MSTPTHHPPEELLLDYATGAAPEAIALVVATHLALCPRCRAEARLLDDVGGALLEDEGEGAAPPLDVAPAPVAPLDEPEPPPKRGAREVPPQLLTYPEPLRSYLPTTRRGDVDWTFDMPGMRYLDLDRVCLGRVPVRISVLFGGSVFPRHTHEGLEISMVLTGGFSDRGETYLRGDLSVADPTVTHHLDVHRGEVCTLLVVNEARLVPRSFLARMLARLFPV